MYIQLFYFLELLNLFGGMILPLILAIAFFTLQPQQNTNVVGFYGLFQAITDGLKLLVKESILPKSSNIIIFIFSPVFTFGLAMAGWLVIVGAENSMLSDFKLKLKKNYNNYVQQRTIVLNAAAAVVTSVKIQVQVPSQTYLQVAGTWVYEHPLLTVALVGGVVILGGVGYTYVFYPHLLGFASAAGSLGATQTTEQQPKACTKALEEALAQATKAQAELLHERGLRVTAESAKDFIQIKSPIQEHFFKETLTRVILENPPQVMVTPGGELRVGVDRTHLMQDSFMDAIQLTHNVLMNQPINTPLPPELLDKAAGAGQQCMDLTVQILLN